MFASNQKKDLEITTSLDNQRIIDPFTIWLIRIACILTILFFIGVFIGLPVALTFGKSQIDSLFLNSKAFIKNFIEISLS